jgi:6,7-dimethyl-8-ribityllumazine synthase
MKNDSSSSLLKAQPEWRVGIVAASFYKDETDALIENISVHLVPGSFEIPLIGAVLAETHKVDALIGIGIIVQGETFHADLLATEVARGIMAVQLEYAIPFAFEVLWVKDVAHAQARLHKGEEAAKAVLQSLAELQRIES